MKNPTTLTLTLTLTAIALLVQPVRGSDEADQQSEFPVITSQPIDQGIFEGETTTFSVQAKNGNLSYQWQRNGAALEGQTNDTLTVENVSTNDVALYSCNVAKNDGESVPTRAASLSVLALDGGGQIIVYGTPILSGGRPNTCPGPYISYVNYTKTAAQGWGWAPTAGTTIHTVADGSRTNTKVQYVGNWGDKGCGPISVTVPHPPVSTKYRFTIYFTNNVPTNAYPIVLTGFDP